MWSVEEWFIFFSVVQQSPMVLCLHKPKTDKKVQWREGTVDNEFMGKKSSKCMRIIIQYCVYVCSACLCMCVHKQYGKKPSMMYYV